MAGTVSAQDMSDTIRALTAQVVQLSTALGTANAKLGTLQQTCDGAWTMFDERMLTVETRVSGIQDKQRTERKHAMKLVNETAIPPIVFSNERKEWTTWSRTMKAYLDCRYSGFRKMLEWAETRDEEIGHMPGSPMASYTIAC